MLSLSFLLVLILVVDGLLDLVQKLIRIRECPDEMLHVVALAANKAAEVKDHPTGLISLSQDGSVGVLEL